MGPYPSPPSHAPGVERNSEVPPAQKSVKRRWPPIAVLTVLTGALLIVWANPREEQHPESYAKLANYKGEARAAIQIGGEHNIVFASWTRDGKDVVAISLRSGLKDLNDRGARYARISSAGRADSTVRGRTEFAPDHLLIKLPVEDRFEDVTVRVEIGGDDWTPGAETASREIRFSPYGTAYDAKTGKALPFKLKGEVIVP
ncbi:hypothetical protein ACIQVA_37250 [Streptomyces microflavus]|uniref:hypothetical protein n=1 Tax=Streptomyces microflavus TaxID=1919 RepID=UPI003812F922